MDIGLHCPLDKCQKLDFLPIKCHYCGQSFCEDHYLPEQHDCPKLSEIPINSTEKPASVSESYEKCHLISCSSPKGAKVKCSKCEKFFCLGCRHPDQHACPVEKAERQTQIDKQKQKILADEKEKADKMKKLEDLGIVGSSNSNSS